MADETILHEDAVEGVIDQELKDVSTHGPIADVGAASGTYVQAEATAVRTAVNGILATLRDAGIIPLT